MSEIIDLNTFRARKAAATPPDKHIARVIFFFDHDIAWLDMLAMLDALPSEVATAIQSSAVVVIP